MAFVTIDEDLLARARPRAIQGLLIPLASDNGVACCDAKAVLARGKNLCHP